ncbi:uncharacterized protein JCM10292_002626 [Rhodotorula paludigena]|uniref:uncharacterized protein n=1 Tax=Rhodotorula paludigena TaxID=86838 RepID=UPI0031784349
MATTITTAAAAAAEGGIPTSVLRLRGEQLVEEHSARRQETVPLDQDGRRSDREYRAPYDGPNPASWPEGRGVPHYRPLRRNEAATRPLGASTDQRIFVTLMMTGVFVLGRVHGAWTSTVGRVADLWEYPIGGQF